MIVTSETVRSLEESHRERLETDVLKEIAERTGMPPSDCLELYYESDIARWVAERRNGVEYLSPGCLADWLLKGWD